MICELDDIKIHYKIIGSGQNVLMIHGFAADHRLMEGCMEKVFENKNFRRIYIDLPGMGKSNSPDSIKSSDQILESVIQFIRKVLSNEKFIIIGESYGGYISRGIHRELQDQIIGLGLICPVIHADRNKRKVPNHKVIFKDRDFLETLSVKEKENFSQYNVILTEENYKRYQDEVLSGIKISDKDFLNRVQEKYEFTKNIDSYEKEIEIPVIILTGKQDSVVGYEDAYSIINNYKRVSYLALDGAGHNLQIEQPEVFHSLFNNWLKNF
jgi:pimeloyl-ACP methyl ester carboxylesterase